MDRETSVILNSGYTFYLSGPITGLDPEESEKNFNDAAAYLDKHIDPHSDIINPRNLKFPEHLKGADEQKVWSYFMRKSLCEMMEADVLVLLDGWEESRGATIEFKIARLLEMPVFTQNLSRIYYGR